jgi:feruloyl-CoA synthase
VTSLIIDQLGQLAERAPRAPLLPERQGPEWQRLTNARAWAESGAVASWLIAQGFGPGAATMSLEVGDTPEAAVLLLGALRAGALLVDRGAALAFASRNGRLVVPSGRHAGLAAAALALCSVDAAVAERRLHIDANTPARLSSDKCVRQGDLLTMARAVTLDRDGSPERQTVDAAR